MTAAKNVYALMLALVIVLSGCFGMAGDDSDAQDSGSDDREQTDDPEDIDREDVDREDERQARTWYTSGGTYNAYWDDPNVDDDRRYCTGWSPQYNSSTGEYIGEVCDGYDTADDVEAYNASHCESVGGVLEENWEPVGFIYGSERPDCRLNFATINTTSGEILMVYQLSNSITISTTCDGVTNENSVTSSSVAGKEFYIADGGAMDCSHDLWTDVDERDSISLQIWSIVYAIQDATVV